MHIERVELTAAQEQQWTQTRALLVWKCPAFTHVFYKMLNNADSKHVALFTKSVPIAATDGENLLLNPDTFFKYNIYERLFIVAHEIMHCIWNHLIMMHHYRQRGKVTLTNGKEYPYSDRIMNMAEDYVINDMLIESQVGQYSKDWLHDTNLGTAKDSVLDVYAKVFDELVRQGRVTFVGKGRGKKMDDSGVDDGQGRFDQHLPPGASRGKDPGQASQDRNETQWATEIAAGVAAQKAQGKMPAGLARVFDEILNPKVDWKEHIRALFARKVGSGSFDWRRADRRLIVRDIYSPGRSGFGAGLVVVGVDTSGSIGDREVAAFFTELHGILEDVQPKEVIVMWCDAKVQRVDELQETADLGEIKKKGAPGGGGTSFIPVFQEIEDRDLKPDALVYFTDGLGSFPDTEPKYQTIWGSIYPPARFPFGDVVDISDVLKK